MNIPKVLLAPMAGISDAAFRHVCIEQGARLGYSEMVSANGLRYGSPKTASLLQFAENETKMGVQLFTNNASSLELCIDTLSKTYGNRIAIFDINMGCPAPKITKNGEGCALMQNPNLAMRLIKAAVAASNIPVSVKFRKGWDEHNLNAIDFAVMAERAGASAVTVHGRTRQQFYSGKSDLSVIKDVKKAVGIKVIASGDIFSAYDAHKALSETGCDCVMVARGALGNPFIFREIQYYFFNGNVPPKASTKERVRMLLRQANLCCKYKGEALAMLQMRKHACWYLKGVPKAAKLREAITQIRTINDLNDLLSPLLA